MGSWLAPDDRQDYDSDVTVLGFEMTLPLLLFSGILLLLLLLVFCTFWFVIVLLVGPCDSLNTEGLVSTGVGDAWPSTRSGGLDDLGTWSWPCSKDLILGIESWPWSGGLGLGTWCCSREGTLERIGRGEE